MKSFSAFVASFFGIFFLTNLSVSATAQTLTLNDGVIVRSTTNPVGLDLGVVSDWANGKFLKVPNSSSDQTRGNPANTTVLRDDIVAALQSYFGSSSRNNPSILRYSLNRNERAISNRTEPDYAPGLGGWKTGNVSRMDGNGAVSLSLQDFLAICQYLKVEPYLEVPATISAADAADLVEFIAGPSSTTSGSKRAALGEEEPWTSVFRKIHLSFCNECGNALSLPGQAFPDRSSQTEGEHLSDFSNRAQDIFAAVRADSYFSSSSFDLVMSVPSAYNYSVEIAIERAHPDSIEIDDFAHFAMNDLASDASLWQAAVSEPFEKVTSPAVPFSLYQTVPNYQSLTACGASGSATCKVNIYESSQDAINGKSAPGEGVLLALQPLLNLQYYAIGSQSISAATNLANGAGNGLGAKQQAATSNPGAAGTRLPTKYLGMQLINQSIIGPMFSCPIANNLKFDFAGSTNGASAIPALKDVPYLYAFCFENGTGRSIVLINTDPAKSHTLSFTGSNPPSGSVAKRQFASGALGNINESPTVQNSLEMAATGAIANEVYSSRNSITLPPSSVTSLDYTATFAPNTATPSFSPPAGTYTIPQSVTVSSTAGTNIYYTTDGTKPTIASTLYAGPVRVNSSNLLRAIAVAPGRISSPIGAAAYAINSLQPDVDVTPMATANASAQTTVTISNTPILTGVPRIGVNMGGETNFGPGQLLKTLNTAGYFPNFYWQSSWPCNTGGTNDTTHWYNSAGGAGSQGYPANFFVGATYIAMNAMNGTSYGSGTITASSSNQTSTGVLFTLSNALSSPCNTSAQDMLIVKLPNASPTLVTPAQAGYPVCSGASWNTTDVSPSAANSSQSLQMPSGCTLSFGIDPGEKNRTNTNPVFAAAIPSWINLNGSYTATFKAKCPSSSGTSTLSVLLGRVSSTVYISSTNETLTCNSNPGAGWTTFTIPFSASEAGLQTQNLQYVFKTNGTVLLQDADVIEGSTVAGNTTGYRDAVVRKLQAIHPGSLRFMDGSDWCSDVADMTSAIGKNRACGDNNYVMFQGNPFPVNYTLRLQLCAFIGADCFITVGQFNQPSDWTTLVNWLSSQGWTSTFAALGNKIYLEEGNEAWNNGVSGGLWAGTGTIYGHFLGPNMAAAKAASGYNSSVIKLVGDGFLGSGTGNYSWTHNALTVAKATPNGLPDFIDNAAYTLANLATYTTSGSNVATNGAPFLDEWAEIENLNSNTSTSISNNASYAKSNFGVGMAVYEMNYGTGYGYAITQSQMDQIAGSVGTALATVQNALLMQSQSKVAGPLNVFTLSQNSYNYSCIGSGCVAGVVPPLWGIERYMACGPGQLSLCADVDRPTSIAMQVVNNAIGSNNNVMTVTQSGTPTFSYAAGQNVGFGNSIQANPAVPYVNCFSYANSAQTNWTVICFNNNLSSSETVTLAGTGAPSGYVNQTIFPNASNLITDHNENTYIGPSSINPVVGIPTATLTSGTSYTIPPASMIALTYLSNGTTVLPAPSFSLAPGTYVGPQTVAITLPSGSTGCFAVGSTPTASNAGTCDSGSQTYAGPITVSSSETINAIATEAGLTNSSVGSATYTITSQAPSFTLSSSTTAQSVAQGASGIDTITVTDVGGFTGSVTLAASGLPSGVTAAFGTNPTTGSSLLTLAASSTATTGAATVTITGISGAVSASTTVVLTVNSAASFTLAPSASTLSVTQSSSGSDTVTVTDLGGFTGSVALAASSLPSGVTAAFSTNPTTGTSVLTLTASATATTGAATVTITGTSGTLTATTSVALTVTSGAGTLITPYIDVNGGNWRNASTATVAPGSAVDLGPQPNGGTWSWTGPNGFTSNARQISGIPLSAGTNTFVSTFTNANAVKSLQTFVVTVAPQLPAPTFSGATGIYMGGQTVAISDGTAGTTIYYTTNGTTPTTSSSVYGSAITVSASMTIKAIAVKTSFTDSAVATATYTINFPSVIASPTPGTVVGSSQTFKWSTGVGVTQYALWLGTTPGASNLCNSGHITATTVTATGLPADGSTIYAQLYYYVGGAWMYTNYTFISAGPPALTSPALGSVLGTSPTFTWSAKGTGATQFDLWLGNTPGTSNFYDSGHTSATSATVSGLPTNGSTIYAQLYYYIGGVWKYTLYTFVSPGPPAIISPTPGSMLGITANFVWSPGIGATTSELTLGTNGPGSSNLYSSGQTTGNTAAVSGLPTTGATIYAQLGSFIGGSWQYVNYTYIDSLPPAKSVLINPTSGSVLGSSATFNWSPGGQVTQYSLWVGTTGPGSSDLYNSGHTTATSATVTGLPQNGQTVYVELFSCINGSWQYTNYTFTEQ